MKAPTQDPDPDRDSTRAFTPADDQYRAVDESHSLTSPSLMPAVVQRLQASVGNRAVSALVAQRREAVRPPASASSKFAAVRADVGRKQKTVAAHPPARSEAARAQGAAKPPPDDKEAQGKTRNAEKMNAAKPGSFDKAAFITAVNEAIAAQAPKNLDEAEKFGDSGRADAVKGQVQGQVAAGTDASAKAIATTTKAAPDTSAAKEKPVTPLVADKPPATPARPDPGNAVPDKAPPAATDFSAGPAQVDRQMADAKVTDDQLAKSNEPEFTGALKQKKAAEKHAATAPAQVRAEEKETLAGAKAQAATAGATAMTTLAGDRKQAGSQVDSGKEKAKSADETKRAKVTAVLQKVFDTTKKDAEGILSGLDKKVDAAFTKGEKAARDAFTADHKRRMKAYKDKRYSGPLGGARWLKDKFTGLPAEANQIFTAARQGYVTRMQQVISGVADIISTELDRAKKRIAAGRNQLQAAVRKLPADLQAIGRQAAGQFTAKFDQLVDSVDAKGKQLVQTLASKYNEALKAVDAEINAEKEKNRGLVAKAVDAVKGAIDTILQLKEMLMGVLAKAAQAVMAILKDPIGFLRNLASAVGSGLKLFIANIGTHLKKGLIGWLLGTMAGAGLQMPAKFDLRGIITMIASMLGLTWASIRARVVQRGIPEQAMTTVEQTVPVAQKLQSQGVAGVTDEIAGQVGDLKGNLLSKISEYLIPTVLIAGITWIISLLNPASAFIRACKMIIDFMTFVVTQGAQIIQFVHAILDAIIAIAGGGAGGVPGLIENALSKSIPVLIGALAAILGIGGIAGNIRSIFQALSRPVRRAVDAITEKIASIGRWVLAKAKKTSGQQKHRDKPGRQIVPRTSRLPVVMAGETHTLTVRPGQEPRLASIERAVREKLARATASLQDPDTEEELEMIIQIQDLNDRLIDTSLELQRKQTSAAQKAFDDLAHQLKRSLQQYGRRFARRDIEAITDEVTLAQALPASEHVPPSAYSRAKHWRGGTEAERRANSSGASQFVRSLTEDRVAALERDTLLTGEVVNKGGGTFHAYKEYAEQIGWERGRPAYWLRAELTGVDGEASRPRGFIHSHPRTGKR
ncbi:phage tail protein [Melissospora conviva]|uniref:phage tail protein n=1 Tax=Melissospora conviva TaxID=3388432 RepID=UPI003C18AA9E